MDDRGVSRALFRCDGAEVPPDLGEQSWEIAEAINTTGPNPDLVVKVDQLSGVMAARGRDLLRISFFVFAADRRVVRGGPVDVHRERWRREITLCIAVADPDFWRTNDAQERLRQALAFGTDDVWTFHFSHADPDDGQLPIAWTADARDRTTGYSKPPDMVILFSGGIDSLCALVEAVRAGRRPLVVSHWAAHQIESRQDRLLWQLCRALDIPDLPHIHLELHRAGPGDGERSQRSRGFLYAALGAVIAAHVGAREAVLADNGYVSINPPINAQLVGALASRGTHPKFLVLVNRLVDLVFPDAVRVVNPLWNRTRAEALQILVESGHPELLAHTFSCGHHQAPQPKKPHCGVCSQCVDRRVAVIAAGLEAHDPSNGYARDLFGDDLPPGLGRSIVFSYFQFASEVSKLDPDWIFDAYGELDACLDPDDPNFREMTFAIPDLLKRHAEEAMAALAEIIRRLGPQLARRETPVGSLLRRWMAGENEHGTRSPEAFGVEVVSSRPQFVRHGRVWIVERGGVKGGLRDVAGTKRLARLLKEEGRDLKSLDLVAGTSPSTAQKTPSEMDPVEQEPRETATGGARRTRTKKVTKVGSVVDNEALEEYHAEIEALDEKLREASARDDRPLMTHYTHQLEWFRQQLRDGLAKGGELREFVDPHERARQTVSKTVWSSVDELKLQIPALHAHLRDRLKLGFLCVYAPERPEHWEVAS